jgi:hypothetical protein
MEYSFELKVQALFSNKKSSKEYNKNNNKINN